MYCLLGGYIVPTTFYGNQKQPLMRIIFWNDGRLGIPEIVQRILKQPTWRIIP